MNTLFLLLAPQLVGAPSLPNLCTGAGDAPYCGSGQLGTGWYLDNSNTSDWSLYYLVGGVDWLRLDPGSTTLTFNSSQATTLAFSDNVTMAGTLDVTGVTTFTGGLTASVNEVTGADALLPEDCGRVTTVTAGIDTATLTLPEASTVIGCTYHIMYIGADGGALLDISPLDSDADGIEGGCTLAASVVTMSGTADADVGLTKATILTGDSLKLTAVSAAMWVLHSVQGICANN